MALTPMLFIGCGGSGGKVVLSLRSRLEEELRRRGWLDGIPEAFQLKWIDVPRQQESHPSLGDPLNRDDYRGLARTSRYREIDRRLVEVAATGHMDRLVGWRPPPSLRLPVERGAGQLRAVGRAVALADADVVSARIRSAVSRIVRQEARQELDKLAALMGVGGAEASEASKPVVFVVSSLAGGTGAGVFLDVCDLVRQVDPELSEQIVAVLFTSEIFPESEVKVRAGMAPNSLAASSELLNAMQACDRAVEPLFGVTAATGEFLPSGPFAVYLVGLETMDDKRALARPDDAYRSVTETLLAMTLDEALQQSFINTDITNLTAERGTRGSVFNMLAARPEAGIEPRSGFVSSFGSARVSVGSSRFGVWARDRLARSVVDFLLKGWEEKGRQEYLAWYSRREGRRVDEAKSSDVVNWVVVREREAFFEECRLWEEDEQLQAGQGRVEHNDVLEGILSVERLNEITKGFHEDRLSELMKQSRKLDQKPTEWVESIAKHLPMRQDEYRERVESAVREGCQKFADGVVPALRKAVSGRLASHGLAPTAGLLKALGAQCESAITQLKAEAERDRVAYDQASERASGVSGKLVEFKVGALLAKWLSDSRNRGASPDTNRNIQANHRWVGDAMMKAVDYLHSSAKAQRCEAAAELLEQVCDRVLEPLQTELKGLADSLSEGDSEGDKAREVPEWPSGSGVSDRYMPAQSEFCLVDPSDWDDLYVSLLNKSTTSRGEDETVMEGSVESARDVVCAGGFVYGASRTEEAPSALRFGGSGWYGPSGGRVEVSLEELLPEQIKQRADLWLRDEDHPMGSFLASGLSEYLDSPERKRRERFGSLLAAAQQAAVPLCRINATMMGHLHVDNTLDTIVSIQPMPFERGHPARKVALDVLGPSLEGSQEQKERLLFSMQRTHGVESVLIVNRLARAVHPAAVSSLYQTVAHEWGEAAKAVKAPDAIYSFWNHKRARCLTEFIPLTDAAVDAMIRGWFLGRLLGLITDLTDSTGPVIHFTDTQGDKRQAPFPWPLLHHGRQPHLHNHKTEWLPALLEHLPMAMMILSQELARDAQALHAYDAMYGLGLKDTADTEIQSFLSYGCNTHDFGPQKQLQNALDEFASRQEADDLDRRKKALHLALEELQGTYIKLIEKSNRYVRGSKYEQFAAIPFGAELFESFVTQLGKLQSWIDQSEEESLFG